MLVLIDCSWFIEFVELSAMTLFESIKMLHIVLPSKLNHIKSSEQPLTSNVSRYTYNKFRKTFRSLHMRKFHNILKLFF